MNGDIDWSLVPSDQLDAATDAYGSDDFTFFGSELWLGFNLADPTYADARFRQAIVQAIDSDKVVADALPGRWPLRSIVPRDVPGYDDDACTNLCDYSQDVARAWLATAFPRRGHSDGDARRLRRSDAAGDARTRSRRSWARWASRPRFGLRPFDEYRSFATSGQQGVFSFGWVGIAPTQDSYLAPLFRSTSPDNVTGFNSPDIDAQIAAARANGERRGRARRRTRGSSVRC